MLAGQAVEMLWAPENVWNCTGTFSAWLGIEAAFDGEVFLKRSDPGLENTKYSEIRQKVD